MQDKGESWQASKVRKTIQVVCDDEWWTVKIYRGSDTEQIISTEVWLLLFFDAVQINLVSFPTETVGNGLGHFSRRSALGEVDYQTLSHF